MPFFRYNCENQPKNLKMPVSPCSYFRVRRSLKMEPFLQFLSQMPQTFTHSPRHMQLKIYGNRILIFCLGEEKQTSNSARKSNFNFFWNAIFIWRPFCFQAKNQKSIPIDFQLHMSWGTCESLRRLAQKLQKWFHIQ